MNNLLEPCPLCGSPAIDRTGYFGNLPDHLNLVECSNNYCPLSSRVNFSGAWDAIARRVKLEKTGNRGLPEIEEQFKASLLEKQKEVDDLQKKIAMREEMIEKLRPMFSTSEIWTAVFENYDERKKNGE